MEARQLTRVETELQVALNFLALVIRARREEEALAAEFGEEWAAYARHVPGGLPCVRRHWQDRF